jgi:hypothetical protein
MPPEPRVKGVTFRSVDACFRELRGEAAWTRAHELMLPEVREAYRAGAILSGSWYPISWYRDILRAYCASVGEGPDLIRMLGYKTAQTDLSRFHNWILTKLVSPQTLFGFSARVFNSYFDTGQLSILESQHGYVRAGCRGCIGWDRNVWNDLIGSSTALLEMAGAKEVRVRVLSGGRDDDTETELAAFWV